MDTTGDKIICTNCRSEDIALDGGEDWGDMTCKKCGRKIGFTYTSEPVVVNQGDQQWLK